ncbi:Telomeric repeat-binding factor 2-interacting protein 1 [Bulinus truncatus]|nr:Telomeric repeat-binding factor 2-interacting protein 1 [Bulinus truncatus]
MAASLNSALNFRFNKLLFRNNCNCKPIVYYSNTPNEDLKNLISKGGGYITDCADEADVLLCEKKTDAKINDGYLPLDFIVACVMKNKHLSVDTYREEVLGLKASTSRDSAKDINFTDDDSFRPTESSRMRLRKDNMTGRMKYNLQEDLNIITYLINHKGYSKTKGNVIWKKMESLKVTQHTYQSMRARFKLITSQIDSYNIPDEWKAKLTGLSGNKSESSASSDEDTAIGASFSAIENWKTKHPESAASAVCEKIGGIIHGNSEALHDVSHNKNQSEAHNDTDTAFSKNEKNNIPSFNSVSPNLSISPISSASSVSPLRIQNGHNAAPGDSSYIANSTPCKVRCRDRIGTNSALTDDPQSPLTGLSLSFSKITEEQSSTPKTCLHATIVENSCSSKEKESDTFFNLSKNPVVRLVRLPMQACNNNQNSSSVSESSAEINSSTPIEGNHVLADEETFSDNLDCIAKSLKLTPLEALYLLKKFRGNLRDSIQYLHSNN